MQVFIPMWAMWGFVISGIFMIGLFITLICYVTHLAQTHNIKLDDLYRNLRQTLFQRR